MDSFFQFFIRLWSGRNITCWIFGLADVAKQHSFSWDQVKLPCLCFHQKADFLNQEQFGLLSDVRGIGLVCTRKAVLICYLIVTDSSNLIYSETRKKPAWRDNLVFHYESVQFFWRRGSLSLLQQISTWSWTSTAGLGSFHLLFSALHIHPAASRLKLLYLYNSSCRAQD